MKIASRIIIVFVVIIVILVIGRNAIVKFVMEKGVRVAVGLPLKIEKIDLGLMTTHIGITEMKLFNPEGFGGGVMFHAPEIFVDYNLGAIIKGKIHLEEVRLDINQLTIVKNEQGQINLDALKPKEEDQQSQKKEEKKIEGKKGDAEEKKAPEMQIDHLVLKVGKVVYKDYSKGGEPSIKEYKVNISEEIDDVMDAKVLLGIIVTKAIAKTALTSLIDFNMDMFGSVTDIPGKAVETLKSTTETLRGKIKFPFGGK